MDHHVTMIRVHIIIFHIFSHKECPGKKIDEVAWTTLEKSSRSPVEDFNEHVNVLSDFLLRN